MTVISDAGPLHYLILIGHVSLLRHFYREVFVPNTVKNELMHPNTPIIIRQFMESKPSWLQVVHCPKTDPRFDGLGSGEREALTLAMEDPGSFLLCDDGAARRAAVTAKIQFAGTLGILGAAAVAGLIDIRNEVDVLRRTTNFHGSSKLYIGVISEVEKKIAQRATPRE